jgi:HAD superfamily hydrolase (TIGR01509 family)
MGGMAPIRWVLFDADGVLQQMPPGWQQELITAVGDDEVLAEIFEREAATMTGGDFRSVVADVLHRRGRSADPDEVLQSWQTVEVDPKMIMRISQLRAAGIGCALATNQQNVRVAYMRGLADYRGVFDEQFYSSELGVAKPSPSYFLTILERLDSPAEQVLFIDDRQDNVTGAKVAGLAAELFGQNAGVTELDRILELYGVDA